MHKFKMQQIFLPKHFKTLGKTSVPHIRSKNSKRFRDFIYKTMPKSWKKTYNFPCWQKMIVPKSLLGSRALVHLLEKSLLKRTTTGLSATQLQNLWRKADFEILLNLIYLYCHPKPFSGSKPPSPLSNLYPASWVERELLRHLPGRGLPS